jgi:tetratricopeptide (TPR) repeat protein
VTHAGNLGYAYALSGRTAEGIPLLERAVSATETMGYGDVQLIFLVYLGDAYVLADRLQQALEVAGRAVSLARESGERRIGVWALRLLGDIASHRDSPEVETAEAYYRQALALADKLEMRPQVAHCHAGLAKLYRRTGKHEQARDHVTTATTMYREMDMRFWLEQAEAEARALA